MNNLCAILDHLITSIFYVAAGTTIASCKSDLLNFGVRVNAKSPFPVPHRSETLPARTASVTIADNYSNLGL
jgi:hypothetical protein